MTRAALWVMLGYEVCGLWERWLLWDDGSSGTSISMSLSGSWVLRKSPNLDERLVVIARGSYTVEGGTEVSLELLLRVAYTTGEAPKRADSSDTHEETNSRDNEEDESSVKGIP